MALFSGVLDMVPRCGWRRDPFALEDPPVRRVRPVFPREPALSWFEFRDWDADPYSAYFIHCEAAYGRGQWRSPGEPALYPLVMVFLPSQDGRWYTQRRISTKGRNGK